MCVIGSWLNVTVEISTIVHVSELSWRCFFEIGLYGHTSGSWVASKTEGISDISVMSVGNVTVPKGTT